MNMTQFARIADAGTVNRARRPARVCLGRRNGRPARLPTESSLIRWPTEQQVQQVSRRLSQVIRRGIRQEIDGDHFNSGDFAYRINEIIRDTDELFRKSQRPKI